LSAIGVAVALAVAGSTAFAQGKGQGGGQGGGGKPPPGGEAAGSNISFPLILSDNVGPTLPADAAWRFATIANPAVECIGEGGTETGTVPPEILCYWGGKVTVVSETGEIVITPPKKVWWLQKRTQNFWKALTVGHNITTPLVVSAVDIGDLLESSPSIGARQIRTEFNLLQQVDSGDPELGGYVVQDWSEAVPNPCVVPTTTTQSLSVGCFAALAMSGAVPGTEQSGNETQGTDFGPGGDLGNPASGTRTLLDPTMVRTSDIGGFHAVVYSRCARLVIQRITGVPSWNPTLGQWDGASPPLVNVAAYRDEYSAEINSGGSIVYGYNWNAKTAATGTYRLTFVLDGNDNQGPKCTVPLATKFGRDMTQMVNVGENNPGHIVYAGEQGLVDEGGLAYIDLTLTTKGGGGGGGKGGPK
jgi:hypothetical protein